VEYIVGIVVAVALLAAYVTWVAGRIDRLHARVAAAQSALDAQLVRRAAVAAQLAEGRHDQLGERAEAVRTAAKACLTAEPDQREAAENDLTRALRGLPLDAGDPEVGDLVVASRRLGVARQVHNDAVRDTLALRRRRLPRALRLGARYPLPQYFDIAEFAVEVSPANGSAAANGLGTADADGHRPEPASRPDAGQSTVSEATSGLG
jgi:hypothetical protein